MAKILIVDDSDIVRALMKEWLSARGHEVSELSSPALFIGTLVREKPDAVVMDIDMPGIQGNKVVATVRETGLLRCPVILCSSRTGEELEFLMRSCGATAAVTKSGDREAFVSAVERQLRA